jgi:hypothetical protein
MDQRSPNGCAREELTALADQVIARWCSRFSGGNVDFGRRMSEG